MAAKCVERVYRIIMDNVRISITRVYVFSAGGEELVSLGYFRELFL